MFVECLFMCQALLLLLGLWQRTEQSPYLWFHLVSSKVVELGWGERLGSDVRLILHRMPGKSSLRK